MISLHTNACPYSSGINHWYWQFICKIFQHIKG
jgi:hypothetical protein